MKERIQQTDKQLVYVSILQNNYKCDGFSQGLSNSKKPIIYSEKWTVKLPHFRIPFSRICN